jgi:hypothetical protein
MIFFFWIFSKFTEIIVEKKVHVIKTYLIWQEGGGLEGSEK